MKRIFIISICLLVATGWSSAQTLTITQDFDYEAISDIIESKDRSKSGITAKPEGLYLNEVYY